jgi:hypothetical protein
LIPKIDLNTKGKRRAQNKGPSEPENAGRNTHDSDEEIEVDNTYQGEVEGMEGDGDNENDSDGQDPQKSKDRYTPLWKYVTKLSGGKGGGRKGVEQGNLYATIVIKTTQVPIPV